MRSVCRLFRPEHGFVHPTAPAMFQAAVDRAEQAGRVGLRQNLRKPNILVLQLRATATSLLPSTSRPGRRAQQASGPAPSPLLRQAFNHCAISSSPAVQEPNSRTGCASLPAGTATKWLSLPTSIPAAGGFTISSPDPQSSDGVAALSDQHDSTAQPPTA